ncbi:WecB/TagA/CpsF family glycosyltransferase [Xinfangfangia sp. D13-10-4-6]|uniref:WecB/TagA/CpsF family glycosyltransferase n=1 Tax=Pseudogemmobacter hezensis TaxID=2737662 RepID=UPI0015539C38|nr:WecB/TagA/CpsF family glycosyltransferase [Pseudogemmobacter hezensis]NPD13869.1 WecB/TagA/CpsF family glycosyltransferase [Pseudogemmobacter hezensis]
METFCCHLAGSRIPRRLGIALTLCCGLARRGQIPTGALRLRFTFDQSPSPVTIRVTHAGRQALLDDVAAHLAAGRGFALATINLDHLVKLQRDPGFRQAYAAQDMVVADGNPIVWLSKLAGKPVALLPGSDLVLPLCQLAAQAGLPVSMLGATAPALAEAADRLSASIPGFRTGLLIAPPMGFDPEGPLARDALSQLAALGPGLCLIALGAPKQERFAALGRQLAPQCGFASVGAGVEFISGDQKRAPLWVRRIAMEWAWRALSAPRRLVPRYAACFAILPGQIVSALRQRGG